MLRKLGDPIFALDDLIVQRLLRFEHLVDFSSIVPVVISL